VSITVNETIKYFLLQTKLERLPDKIAVTTYVEFLEIRIAWTIYVARICKLSGNVIYLFSAKNRRNNKAERRNKTYDQHDAK
jgi:hypothetical protein